MDSFKTSNFCYCFGFLWSGKTLLSFYNNKDFMEVITHVREVTVLKPFFCNIGYSKVFLTSLHAHVTRVLVGLSRIRVMTREKSLLILSVSMSNSLYCVCDPKKGFILVARSF